MRTAKYKGMKNSQIHKMTQNPIIFSLCYVFFQCIFPIAVFYSQIPPTNTVLSVVFFILSALRHELYKLFFIVI